jgi:hypothetical protein
MHKKFIVRLADEERGVCQEIIKHLKGSSQKFRRAQILLKTDADGPAWSDVRIAEAFNPDYSPTRKIDQSEHV